MNSILYGLLLLLSPPDLDTASTRVKIVDSISLEILPLVYMRQEKKSAVYPVLNGSFTMSSSEMVLSFTCPGYVTKTVTLRGNDTVILLQPIVYNLDEMVYAIKRYPKIVRQQLTVSGRVNCKAPSMPLEFATLINMDAAQTPVRIRSVSLLAKKKFVNNGYRINIYEQDSNTHQPGRLLYSDNQLGKDVRYKNGRMVLDLHDIYIISATNGVFVGFESLGKFALLSKDESGTSSYFMTQGEAEVNTFSRTPFTDIWVPFDTRMKPGDNPMNLAVGVEYLD